MDKIKVSVILPVYNVEKYLRQCMDSIVHQTLREIEIICVDDGSADNSLQILHEYAAVDPRVRVIEQANCGAGAARNNGLAVASGEYLSFLDSDDFFEPDMLETAYAVAVRDSADIVVFDSDQYDESSAAFRATGTGLKRDAIPPFRPFSHGALSDNVFTVFIGWAWDKLFRTDFVRAHALQFQQQRTTNDLLFVFSAVVLAKKISIADKVLVHQRCNLKDSLSSTRERSWRCFYDALTALRENLVSYGLLHELEQDYINYALHFSLWQLETICGPMKAVLYDQLRDTWFAELGIADKSADYFYSKKEYRKYLEIKNKDFARYSADKARRKKIKRALHKLPIGRG